MNSFSGEKRQCPACAAKGEDLSGDNLNMREDQSGFCFKCNLNFSSTDLLRGAAPKVQSELKKSQMQTLDVERLPVAVDPARRLSQSIAEKYNVRAGYDTRTGEINTLHYPYEGGYKTRRLPKEFYATGAPTGLFKPVNVKLPPTGNCILLEGEEDALACAHILQEIGKDTHTCVSIPNGVSSMKTVKNEIDFFSQFKKIYIWMDADEAGHQACIEFAEILCTEVNEVRVVSTPEGYKDASDLCVQQEYALAWGALLNAEAYEPEGVVDGATVSVQDLMKPSEPGVSLPFPILDAKLHGLRKGEITTLTAGSGIGKTTIAKEIGVHLVKSGHSIAHIPLEDPLLLTQQAYVAIDNNVPASMLSEKPHILPESAYEASRKAVIEPVKWYKHHGSVKFDKLLKKMEYFVYKKNVDFIILDHLSIVVSGYDVQNERKAFDMIMTELATFVVRTGVGLLQIVHLKRRETGAKAFGEGGKPSLSDLRGSASLEQLSWNVISAARDQQAEDGSEDLVNLYLLKNRMWGRTGLCDTLKYNHLTGRLEALSEEDVVMLSSKEEAA